MASQSTASQRGFFESIPVEGIGAPPHTSMDIGCWWKPTSDSQPDFAGFLSFGRTSRPAHFAIAQNTTDYLYKGEISDSSAGTSASTAFLAEVHPTGEWRLYWLHWRQGEKLQLRVYDIDLELIEEVLSPSAFSDEVQVDPNNIGLDTMRAERFTVPEAHGAVDLVFGTTKTSFNESHLFHYARGKVLSHDVINGCMLMLANGGLNNIGRMPWHNLAGSGTGTQSTPQDHPSVPRLKPWPIQREALAVGGFAHPGDPIDVFGAGGCDESPPSMTWSVS